MVLCLAHGVAKVSRFLTVTVLEKHFKLISVLRLKSFLRERTCSCELVLQSSAERRNQITEVYKKGWALLRKMKA